MAATPERMVPYVRLQEQAAKNRELAQQLADMKKQLGELGDAPAKLSELTAQLEKVKEDHKAEKAGWEEERGLVGAGLGDPEGQAVARTLYGRLPEESRPKSLSEWVGGLKVEGATVPAALKPYLAPADAGAGAGSGSGAAGAGSGAGGGAGAPGTREPPKASGTGRQPPADGGANAEAIRRANAAFRANPNAENRSVLAKLVGMAP